MINEFDILIVFFPLLFVAFDALVGLRKFFCGCALVLALICNIYQARLFIDDPLWLLPIAAFFSVVIIGNVQKKRFRGLVLLGALFITQAFMTKFLSGIVILLLFSDVFFCTEKFISEGTKGRIDGFKNLYRAIISFCPVIICLLLKLEGEWLGGGVALTIFLRLFDWPFSNSIKGKGTDRELQDLCVGAIAAFILWRTQDVGHEPIWALIWIAASVVLSAGCDLAELLPALSLSLFAISPTSALLIIVLWPLLLRQQPLQILLAIFGAGIGFLTIPIATNNFLEQGAIIFAIFSALLLARAWARERFIKPELIYDGSSVLLFLLLLGGIYFSYPEIFRIQEIQISGIVFSGSLLIFFTTGKFLFKKKVSLFNKIKTMSIDFSWASKFRIKEAEPLPPANTEGPSLLVDKLFNYFEEETYLVFLLGALGAFLIWGSV